EAEDAEDVAGDVPGRLRVPAVRDLDDYAEAVRKLRMLDREAEEAVSAFLRDHAAVTRLQDRRVEAIEAADQIGMLDHRVPDPVVAPLRDQVREQLREVGYRHRDRR